VQITASRTALNLTTSSLKPPSFSLLFHNFHLLLSHNKQLLGTVAIIDCCASSFQALAHMNTELQSTKAVESSAQSPPSQISNLPGLCSSTRLCQICSSMLSTLNGIQGLASRHGYTHHKLSQLMDSAERGCPLCMYLYKLASPNSLGLEIGQGPTEPSIGISGWHHDDTCDTDGPKSMNIVLKTLSVGRSGAYQT